MGRVFISHSAEDASVANEICAAIERRGIPCWIAPRNVVAGEEFAECIDRAIEASSAFVLVLSRASNDSYYVKSEADTAVSYKRPIFPVRIENIEPSKTLKFLVNRWHRIDAFGAGRDSGILRLAEAVSRRVSGGSGGRTSDRNKRPGGISSNKPPSLGAWHWPAFLGGIFWLFSIGVAGLGWAALCGLLAFVLLGTILLDQPGASLGLFIAGWLGIAGLIAIRARNLSAARAPIGSGRGVPAICASVAAIVLLLLGLRALEQPAAADHVEVAAASNSVDAADPGEIGSGPSTASGLTDPDAIARQDAQAKMDIYNAGVTDTVNAIIALQANTTADNSADGIEGEGATNGM